MAIHYFLLLKGKTKNSKPCRSKTFLQLLSFQHFLSKSINNKILSVAVNELISSVNKENKNKTSKGTVMVPRSSHPEVFCKNVFLKNFKNLQKSTCAGVSFHLSLFLCLFSLLYIYILYIYYIYIIYIYILIKGWNQWRHIFIVTRSFIFRIVRQ